MKNVQIVALLALLMIDTGLHAQVGTWQDISGGLQAYTTTGKVGIGINPPSSQLHVGNTTGWDCSSTILTQSGIRLDDYTNLSSGPLPNFSHNVFEIYHKRNICPFGTAGLPLIFFVNTYDDMGLGGSTTVTVGINKATASSTLDVGGSINADGNLTVGGTANIQGNLIDMNGVGGADGVRNIYGNSSAYWMGICSGGGGGSGATGSYLQLFTNGYSAEAGNIYIVPSLSTSSTTFRDPLGNVNMTVGNDGQVVIGNVPSLGASSYKLYVETGIITEKLKVQNHGDPWSDFVFNKDYKLMPLNKVESFVKANKHLPGIPSAKEVQNDGIDVAGMDAKLLQKLEELTLYVIEQQKQISRQQGEIEELRARNRK